MKRFYRRDNTDPNDVKLEEFVPIANDVVPNQILIWDEDANHLTSTGEIDVEKLHVLDNLSVEGTSHFKGQVQADEDVVIKGNLTVDGETTTINKGELSAVGDYILTRVNNNTPLGSNEYSGLAVHNFKMNKDTVIVTDDDGTWRVGNNAAETHTNYSNIALYNEVYYNGLTQDTPVDVGPGLFTNFDMDEAYQVVYYNGQYYEYSNVGWYPLSLVNNSLEIGSKIQDETLIANLDALTKKPLYYYRSLEVTGLTLDNLQPILTRDEEANLSDDGILLWDATNKKAITLAKGTKDQFLRVRQYTVEENGEEVTKLRYEWSDPYPEIYYFDTYADYKASTLDIKDDDIIIIAERNEYPVSEEGDYDKTVTPDILKLGNTYYTFDTGNLTEYTLPNYSDYSAKVKRTGYCVYEGKLYKEIDDKSGYLVSSIVDGEPINELTVTNFETPVSRVQYNYGDVTTYKEAN